MQFHPVTLIEHPAYLALDFAERPGTTFVILEKQKETGIDEKDGVLSGIMKDIKYPRSGFDHAFTDSARHAKKHFVIKRQTHVGFHLSDS
jgi:hypothetical protein